MDENNNVLTNKIKMHTLDIKIKKESFSKNEFSDMICNKNIKNYNYDFIDDCERSSLSEFRESNEKIYYKYKMHFLKYNNKDEKDLQNR